MVAEDRWGKCTRARCKAFGVKQHKATVCHLCRLPLRGADMDEPKAPPVLTVVRGGK